MFPGFVDTEGRSDIYLLYSGADQQCYLLTDRKQMRKTSLEYCWRPNLVFPYESLWSLLQKFALWNVCSISAIVRHFGKSNSRLKGGSLQNLNVLIKLYLDKEKLRQKLPISEGTVNKSVAQYYLLPKEIPFFVSPVLRFCPACISVGYHSIYHQFLFFEKCPIHNILHETKCRYCGSFIETNFNATNFKKPYSCPTCLESLLSYKLSSLGNRFISAKNNLEKIEKILVTRRRKYPKTMDLRLWSLSEKDNSTLKEILFKIYSFWSTVYIKGLNNTNLDESNRNGVILFQKRTLQHNNHLQFEFEVPLYKSFNRNLRQLLLRWHAQCFLTMKSEELDFLRNGLEIESKICPLVLAYIYWRRYWEQDDQVLFPGRRSSLKKPFQFLSIKSYCYSIDNWVGSHIFIRELKATFIESIYKVRQNIDPHFFITSSPQMMFQHFPYWESYTDHMNNKSFVWFSRSRDIIELLKQTSCTN